MQLFRAPGAPCVPTCAKPCPQAQFGWYLEVSAPSSSPSSPGPTPTQNPCHPKISLGKETVPNGHSPGIGTYLPLGKPSMSMCL